MKLLHPLTCRESSHERDPKVRTGGSTGKIGSFGLTRNGGKKMHKGVDWLANPGDPVFAAHAGLVARDGEQSGGRGFGQRLYISSHDGKLRTIYAHLSAQTVRAGQKIRAGHLIGFVGRSGNLSPEDPTHLHFEFHEKREEHPEPVDPVEALLEEFPGT
jgi:murein DD-endopeptidase MepM/ murein hydrolase activator NlpD